MGLDIVDLIFRLERTFSIQIERKEFLALIKKNPPHDIMVGDLFELVKNKAYNTGLMVLDDETDAELLWAMFQHAVSDALGVEQEEVTKDKWVIHELGAT